MSAGQGIRKVVAGLVVVGAVLLPGISAGGLPNASAALIGTWTNATATSGIVKLVISPAGTGIRVNTFTKCGTKLCQSGKVSGLVFGVGAGSATGASFRTNQTFPGSNRVMLGRVISGPRIALDVFNTYKDGVRYNTAGTRVFKRVGAATSTTSVGVSATTYPSGRQSRAPNSFLGTWHNTNAATTDIVQYIITRAANGSLLVHEFGACDPTPCDNGTHSAISYGPSTTATTANRFLVPNNYGFANDLTAGSLSLGVLTMRVWTQFTDGSGRSNYTFVGTFTH
jgi:hypothetical protein